MKDILQSQNGAEATPACGGAPGQFTELAEAVETVKALLAAGLLDPAAFGVTLSAGAAPEPAKDQTAVATDHVRRLVPGQPITIRELVKKTEAGMTENTARTYMTYLTFLAEGWPAKSPQDEKLYPGMGDRWAHEVLASELEEALRLVEVRTLLGAHHRAERRHQVKRHVRETKGLGAKYNAVGAWRRMFKTAVKDRHLAKGFDPSQEVRKPTRLEGNRRPLTEDQMEQFWALVTNTGNDPELDTMLAQTILVSGARREGLLNLGLGGIDLEECTVRLDEKFGKVVDQPVPDWFAAELRAFALSRGCVRPDDKVFRTRSSTENPWQPITGRRLDYIFQRLQSSFTWADKLQVTAHVLRHHAIAVVERSASKAVSVAFARHEPEDTTGRYGRASKREVAQAVVRLYGGDHPWLHRDPAVE